MIVIVVLRGGRSVVVAVGGGVSDDDFLSRMVKGLFFRGQFYLVPYSTYISAYDQLMDVTHRDIEHSSYQQPYLRLQAGKC